MLAKILIILFCVIIQTHAWPLNEYPSPRGTTYWKCGVTKPVWVCDPDGVLNYQQRKEIVDLIENFLEKTKRPNSTVPSMREGVRLEVALSNFEFDLDDGSFRYTNLCTNDRIWMLADSTKFGRQDVQKIEFVNTNGFLYCYSIRDLMLRHNEDYKLPGRKTHHLKMNYPDALKNYLENLLKLYNQRFSSFNSHNASKKGNMTVLEKSGLQKGDKKLAERQQTLDQGNETLTDFHAAIEEINGYGSIAILICLIIGLVLLFLVYRICQFGNYFKRTPIQPLEVIDKKDKKKEVEDKSKLLLNA